MIDFNVQRDLCISCGLCVRDCPQSIISLKNDYPAVSNEEKCLRCGHCLAACPQGAISVLGHHPSGSAALQDNLPTPSRLETLIKGRRSVRHYKDKDLDPSLIKDLLDTASHAPTGTNSQKLLISVLDKREDMHAFKTEVYARLNELLEQKNLPGGERRKSLLTAAPRLWKEEGRDLIFRNAPHCLLVSNANDASCVEQDPLIFLSYFELMAQDMGVGTVWCGLLYWALKMLPDLLPRLGIPEDHTLGYAMLFGYPAFSYYRTVERDPARVNLVTWK